MNAPFACMGDGALSVWEKSSTVRVVPSARPRKLAKVPFVELADGRLQGVVSSGSDIGRVYVSSVAASSYAFSCSTNNNRPCGGARGSFCNHIRALVAEAVLQYGAERVARYLKVEAGDAVVRPSLTSAMITGRAARGRGRLGGGAGVQPVPATARLPRTRTRHLPVARDRHWFPTTGAVAA
ncbi:SWIM-type domain-containing protein OS=Streptomyces tendae OX=1932 GN=F3L20_14370 PE=4 SV=1 [Streptomyces tendae]